MYIPEHFAKTDLPALHEFMRQHSFASVVTLQGGRPFASHLPMLLDSDIGTHGVLLGHMARNNPQWRDFSADEVLVMFHGPHAYVSPAWYEPNPMAVPTWNFMAVHAYGAARILPEEELKQALQQLVDENEKALSPPWELDLSRAMREKVLPAIVGFEIRLNRIEGKFKLNQNRSEQDQRNVAAHLSQSTHGNEVAHAMGKELERK